MKIGGIYKCSLVFNPEGTPLALRHYGEMKLYIDPEDDNDLKGSMFPTFFWLNSPFRNGKVDGNKFEFTVYFATPCQQFAMTVRGEINGTQVTGEADTPTGVYKLEGTRISE